MSYTLFLLLWAPQCPFCLSNGMSLQKKRAKTAKEATRHLAEQQQNGKKPFLKKHSYMDATVFSQETHCCCSIRSCSGL